MPRTGFAVDHNSPPLQHGAKKLSCEFSGIVNGKSFLHTTVAQRYCSPEYDLLRSQITVSADLADDSSGRCGNAIFNLVVIRIRLRAQHGLVAGMLARHDVHEDHVVIEGEGGDRRTVDPLHVVLGPA